MVVVSVGECVSKMIGKVVGFVIRQIEACGRLMRINRRNSPRMTSPTNKLNVTVMKVENFCNETKRKRSNMTPGQVGTVIEFRLITDAAPKLAFMQSNGEKQRKFRFHSVKSGRGKVFNNRALRLIIIFTTRKKFFFAFTFPRLFGASLNNRKAFRNGTKIT